MSIIESYDINPAIPKSVRLGLVDVDSRTDTDIKPIRMKVVNRLDKMSTLIFDRDNLVQIHSAVNGLFTILFDLVDDVEGCARNTHKEMLDKLTDVDIQKWSNIRSKFLEEPYYGYSDGDFSNEEEKDFVKLMMDMLNVLEKTRSGMTNQIKNYYDIAKNQKNEIKVLQVELLRYQEENMEMKWKQTQDKADLGAIKASMVQVKNSLKEKRDQIYQLQRDGTVQLWEREKTRVLEASDKREKDLIEQVKKLKEENEQMREKLTKRLIDADDQFKRLKIRQELQMKPTNDEKDKEVDLMKKKVFLLEKDLNSIEQQFLKYQRYFCAIAHGAQRDVKILCERLKLKYDETDSIAPDKPSRKEMSKLAERLSSIYEAMMQGRLLVTLADLPDHYLMLDKDMKPVNIKRLSQAYTSNTPADLDQTTQPGIIPDKSISAIELENAEKKLIRRESKKNMRRSSLAERRTSVTEQPPSKANGTIPEKGADAVLDDDDVFHEERVHPELIYRETNRLNMIACMRHFPHMGRDYVLEQWDQFQKYDANGDYALDLAEMMTAMTSTIGQQFTAQQIKEAMIEVDIDGSDTIDFYEYLTIANMLAQKTGKSNVFRSELAQKQGNLVSRTCVIQ